MTDDWRPVINAVLWMTQFAPTLDEGEVRRIATSLLEKPFGDLTPEQEYQALVEALDSGEQLDAIVRVKHSPTEIRRFLAGIVAELDARRPWQDAALREIPISRWAEFADAVPIARISVPWPTIEGKVDKTFKRVGGGEGVLLRMRSGIELGLVWPGRAGKSETDILSLGTPQSASAIIQELIGATSLKADEIALIEGR